MLTVLQAILMEKPKDGSTVESNGNGSGYCTDWNFLLLFVATSYKQYQEPNKLISFFKQKAGSFACFFCVKRTWGRKFQFLCLSACTNCTPYGSLAIANKYWCFIAFADQICYCTDGIITV